VLAIALTAYPFLDRENQEFAAKNDAVRLIELRNQPVNPGFTVVGVTITPFVTALVTVEIVELAEMRGRDARPPGLPS
jgi:hypothetical protein